MDKQNNYFFISGFIAFFMLFLVLVLFSYVLFSSQKVKSYALKKDKAITVSIIMNTRMNTKQEKAQSIQKEETPAPKDVSSLFSSVWTKPVDKLSQKKPELLDKDVLPQLVNKLKKSTQNNTDSLQAKVDNTKLVKADVKVTSDDGSSGEEVNEYLAKIQGQIYNNFFPPANTQGQSAKILVRLSASGEVLDFRVLNYSGNELFNTEVDRLGKSIFTVKFPNNPDNKDGNYIITLVAKE